MAAHQAQRTNQCFDVKSIQGYILRLFMLNIFVSDLDDASEYTVNQITDDTKLGWGMTKDRTSVQRNLEKTSEFGQHNPGKDEQSEVQRFVLEWKKHAPWYKPGTHWLRNRQPCWKGFTGDARLNIICQWLLIMNKTKHKLCYMCPLISGEAAPQTLHLVAGPPGQEES